VLPVEFPLGPVSGQRDEPSVHLKDGGLSLSPDFEVLSDTGRPKGLADLLNQPRKLSLQFLSPFTLFEEPDKFPENLHESLTVSLIVRLGDLLRCVTVHDDLDDDGKFLLDVFLQEQHKQLVSYFLFSAVEKQVSELAQFM
jgi:hypothetical protein